MKILQCHNFYQQPGGEDRVLRDEAALLRARGHEVVQFTKHNDSVSDVPRVRLALGTIWNRRSAAELKQVVRIERPDIVHFHNTLPLISPAAYYAARNSGAAVVQTLHNYRFICPSATLFRGGAVCEQCVGKALPWPAVRHGCYRNNRAATAAVATMLAFHRSLGTYSRAIDAYIACSEFAKRKLCEGGLPAAKVVVKPNFLVSDPGMKSERGDYAMFLGRLSPEKGIETLLAAWKQVAPHVRLKAVGNGPLGDSVRQAATGCPNLEWLPGKSDAEVADLMAAAQFLVLPSVNYEGFPKTIVESLALGTPIVASRLGAMAELIHDGRTGRLFRPGDADDLATVVSDLYGDSTTLAQMRSEARREYEQKYTAARNYELLSEIYGRAAAHRRGETISDDEHPSDGSLPIDQYPRAAAADRTAASNLEIHC